MPPDATPSIVTSRAGLLLIGCLCGVIGCGRPDPETERRRKEPPRPFLVYQVGMEVDDLGLADTSETSHSIESYRGRIVVLEFWGCRSKAVERTEKARQALIEKYAPRDVVYLVVDSNFDEYPSEMEEYLRDHGSSYTVLADWDNEAVRRFAVIRIPHAIVLDRRGVVRFSGCPFSPEQLALDEAKNADWLEEALDALLEGHPPDPAIRPPAGDKIRPWRSR